jgi:hypothetical protein
MHNSDSAWDNFLVWLVLLCQKINLENASDINKENRKRIMFLLPTLVPFNSPVFPRKS